MTGLLHIPESLSIALHACLWIADGDRAYRPSPQLAQELGFSRNHLAKIVQRLVHGGLLETERGRHGGIRLARPAQHITLLDIYEAAGGTPLQPHRCLLNPTICAGRACGLGLLIEQGHAQLHKTLKKTTLARLARSLDKTQLVPA
jgi:Rrf2 family nitric oxide-sensitive transcriptional repressor